MRTSNGLTYIRPPLRDLHQASGTDHHQLTQVISSLIG